MHVVESNKGNAWECVCVCVSASVYVYMCASACVANWCCLHLIRFAWSCLSNIRLFRMNSSSAQHCNVCNRNVLGCGWKRCTGSSETVSCTVHSWNWQVLTFARTFCWTWLLLRRFAGRCCIVASWKKWTCACNRSTCFVRKRNVIDWNMDQHVWTVECKLHVQMYLNLNSRQENLIPKLT